jgi:hypothetical protein
MIGPTTLLDVATQRPLLTVGLTTYVRRVYRAFARSVRVQIYLEVSKTSNINTTRRARLHTCCMFISDECLGESTVALSNFASKYLFNIQMSPNDAPRNKLQYVMKICLILNL